jgi:hypothetical protein
LIAPILFVDVTALASMALSAMKLKDLASSYRLGLALFITSPGYLMARFRF